MPNIQSSGSQLVTADIAVGTSGVRTIVYAIHVLSGGGGAAAPVLRNGTSGSGTIYIQETGTVSTGKSFEYGTQGFVFPGGCFCDVDANTTSVLVEYSQ